MFGLRAAWGIGWACAPLSMSRLLFGFGRKKEHFVSTETTFFAPSVGEGRGGEGRGEGGEDTKNTDVRESLLVY